MSVNFEYNQTSSNELQEMKQKNEELNQQNSNLKKTLQEMIKVNNELSDTIQQLNNAFLSNPQLLRNIQQNHKTLKPRNSKSATTSFDHQQCKQLIQSLQEQVEYFKKESESKINQNHANQNNHTNNNNEEIISTLEGMIESFVQMQKYYENEINAICQQFYAVKDEWNIKITKIQQSYLQKIKIMEEMTKQLRKKQQIVTIIQKKIMEEPNKNTKKNNKKNNQTETSSERKMNGNCQKEENQNLREIQELKEREKVLNQSLKDKDKTIAIYNDLLAKLKKKLTEKY